VPAGTPLLPLLPPLAEEEEFDVPTTTVDPDPLPVPVPVPLPVEVGLAAAVELAPVPAGVGLPPCGPLEQAIGAASVNHGRIEMSCRVFTMYTEYP
jgi:hypothetical protein